MGHHLAKLGSLFLVGGCSFIYNPDDLPKPQPDAKEIDAAIDANPNDLELTSVDSPALDEGVGDEGSRPAVLVIHGNNITSDATVSIAATTGTANVELMGAPVIASDNSWIAVPVIARVDDMLASGASTPLTITVTQAGTVTKTIDWQLTGYDELAQGTPIDISNNAEHRFSKVDIASLTLTGSGRIIVRANASLKVSGAINISGGPGNNAVAGAAGPGGFPGGVGGQTPSDGGGPGGGKQGTAGSAGGGGGGNGTKGDDGGSNPNSGHLPTGDVLVTKLADNAGSGGGGSNVAGGGGGGTIELSAGGTLEVAAITSNGGAGDNAGALQAAGGGGSGGTIVLRAGAMATLDGDLTANGGAAGTAALLAKGGGKGGAGKIRIDALTIVNESHLGIAHRGAMFDPTTEIVTRSAKPMIKLIGTAGDKFDLQPVTATFNVTGTKVDVDFGGNDTVGVPVDATPGWNRYCVVPMGGSIANAESRNCIDIAYVP